MEGYTIDKVRNFELHACFEMSERFSRGYDSMFRLIHIMEGSGILKINNEITVFSAPALFCINELDEIELQKSINLVAQAVYFHPTVINDSLDLVSIRDESTNMSLSEYRDYFLITPFIERPDEGSYYIEIGPLASRKVSQLFEYMKNELTYIENDFWPCRCRSFLLETLFLIQYMITDSKNKRNIELPNASEEISDIVLFLHANYEKKITIDELTSLFHINRTTLSANFRKSTGLSIMEYLIKYRIKMASVMLRDTMLPISEILNIVGFKDSVHFSRMFRKHTGYTPSSYREKYIVQSM